MAASNAILFIDGCQTSREFGDNLLSLAGHFTKSTKSGSVSEYFYFVRDRDLSLADQELLWWSGVLPDIPVESDGDFRELVRSFFDTNKIKPSTPVICYDPPVLAQSIENSGLVIPMRPPLGIRDYYMVLANRGQVPILKNPFITEVADNLGVSWDFPLDALSRVHLIEACYKEMLEMGIKADTSLQNLE